MFGFADQCSCPQKAARQNDKLQKPNRVGHRVAFDRNNFDLLIPISLFAELRLDEISEYPNVSNTDPQVR